MEVLVLLAVSFVLILINGIFVAAEFGIISVARPRIATLAAEGSSAARRVNEIITSAPAQDRYIATAQLGLSLASLGLGMYAEHGLVGWLTPHLEGIPGLHAHTVAEAVSTGLVLAALTFFHIVLGEMVPKSIALARPEKTAFLLVWPMRVVYVVFYPIIAILNVMGNATLGLLKLPISADVSTVYSQDELRLIFEESHEEGLLEGEEHRLMQRVIAFGKRAVRQVMVSRTKTVALPVEATVDQALKVVAAEGYTRYPVYERNIDHIVGMVHVKDLVRSRLRGPGDRPLGDLKRYVPLVPESMLISEMFEKMQTERVQMAVVLDEHGGTDGIVTMEDLVEEIFGEVRDEFDAEEEEPMARQADGDWRVQGSVLLPDLAEVLDVDLEYEDVETVNGLIMDLLGRPPRVGDVVEDRGVRYQVNQVADNLVLSATVTLLKPPAEDE
ncbi:MAG: HlyC/CorC family transporter [Armatimonadetes bacterium]|nr:HlyC/CorC family transporter [Armatimonadota bacterium]